MSLSPSLDELNEQYSRVLDTCFIHLKYFDKYKCSYDNNLYLIHGDMDIDGVDTYTKLETWKPNNIRICPHNRTSVTINFYYGKIYSVPALIRKKPQQTHDEIARDILNLIRLTFE